MYVWIIGDPVVQILLNFLEIEADAVEVELAALPIGGCFVVLPNDLLSVRLILVLAEILALPPEELKSPEGEEFPQEEEEVSCRHHTFLA